MWTARIIPLLFAAILVLACGGEEETVETEGGTFTVEREGKGIRISGKDEEAGVVSGQFGENAEVPDGFPEDVPVYPDAKVLGSMVTGEGTVLTLRTADDSKKVTAFYHEKLSEQGWSLASEIDLGGQHMLAIEKEERSGAVQISREGNETSIIVTVRQGG
jgi:hypothetical protein